MRRFRDIILCALAALGLSVFFQNCGQGFTSLDAGDSGLSSLSTQSFSASLSASPAVMNLGTQLQVPVTLQSLGFSGAVDLTIDTTNLDAYDVNGTVDAHFDQTHLMLGSAPVVALLNIEVPESAPTLNTYVNVVVTESFPAAGRAAYTAMLKVPLQVQARYVINITSGAMAIETWSSPTNIQFATHPEGITISFHNASTVPHFIHSAGPIPHAAAELAPGDSYEYTVTTQDQMTDTYYCHEHEDPAQAARTMVFNATAAAPTHIASGNPNATYTYLAANVLTKCQSCHGNSTQFGGVNLTSYAKLVSQPSVLIAGSATSSGLYLQTSAGYMPQGGPRLSASDVQAIEDWINDGALNN